MWKGDASPLPSSDQFHILFLLYKEFQVGNNPTQSQLVLLEAEGSANLKPQHLKIPSATHVIFQNVNLYYYYKFLMVEFFYVFFFNCNFKQIPTETYLSTK